MARMKLVQHSFGLLGICTGLLFSTSAQAGKACDWLGIGCDPVTATGRSAADDAPAPTMIDQNNPPEVFSFTVSGAFKQWTDIPKEPFVCDTREREDRACMWQGYLPEIKRNATFTLEPFAHDRGMYKLRGFIANKLGKDPAYSGDVAISVQAQGLSILAPFNSASITKLVTTPLIVEFRSTNHKGEANVSAAPVGQWNIAFKEVLR